MIIESKSRIGRLGKTLSPPLATCPPAAGGGPLITVINLTARPTLFSRQKAATLSKLSASCSHDFDLTITRSDNQPIDHGAASAASPSALTFTPFRSTNDVTQSAKSPSRIAAFLAEIFVKAPGNGWPDVFVRGGERLLSSPLGKCSAYPRSCPRSCPRPYACTSRTGHLPLPWVPTGWRLEGLRERFSVKRCCSRTSCARGRSRRSCTSIPR